ncbi:MAG: adenylate kinase [Clostridia bacterium]|nr:adenylate kinase [Clostridia bacterium]
MNKVIVIGCPGSGKSTFSRELHNLTHIPLYHLDMIYWNKDKTTVSKSVFLQRLSNIIKKEKWIIDGNYGSTMKIRLDECDTVFFLDYQVEVCLEGVLSRRGNKREDMPWIEDENHVDEEFIQFIKNYNSESRPKVIELLNMCFNKKIYIFKTRADGDRFFNELKTGL